VQGFIRRYAEALGLEGAEFAEAFPAERSLHIAQSSWKDSPAAQLRPLHLYIAYVALIMASVSLLSFIVGRSAPSETAGQGVNTTSQAIAPATSPSAQTAINSGQVSATPTRNAPKRPAVSGKPVQIDVKLTAQSWLEVEVDGEVKLAEVLAEGTEQTWTAEKQIRVRAGNAGGVLVAHNGSQPTHMGVPGAVEEKIFAPTTAAAASAASSSAQ
jgi:cytoskeletal protein RodZ